MGAEDVERAVNFWSQVLGYEPVRSSGRVARPLLDVDHRAQHVSPGS